MKVLIVFALAIAVMPAPARASQDAGKALYDARCASCHGLSLEGGPQAPPLLAVDAGMVDFMLRTGRMPATVPWEQEFHHTPQVTQAQISTLESYVMSHSYGTKPLPMVKLPPSHFGLRKGREVFAENCEQCHGATGHGDGAVGYRNVAPSLMDDTPLEIAEAVREGPDVMPQFGPKVIDGENLGDLIAYVQYLQHGQYNPGGLQLANYGPVAEGFIAWTFGLGLLVLLVRRIGTTE